MWLILKRNIGQKKYYKNFIVFFKIYLELEINSTTFAVRFRVRIRKYIILDEGLQRNHIWYHKLSKSILLF